ncbi:hypothetical protein K440DRAFT_662156 [Wilcoxina mikolae CBS 423.85]|nr:hypothetical protein K440DRAFT_662156 [Wilcoxina mikolae CBS 423.85]
MYARDWGQELSTGDQKRSTSICYPTYSAIAIRSPPLMSTSAPILDIDLSSIQPVAHPATISNYAIQASYNHTTSSTLLIPGLPAHWTPPGTPRLHIPPVATARQQRYPFLPALLSLLAQNSSFTLTSPSAPALITSRKTLLSLYTLLATKQPQKAVFTCNVVGKTVFLRKKDEARERRQTQGVDTLPDIDSLHLSIGTFPSATDNLTLLPRHVRTIPQSATFNIKTSTSKNQNKLARCFPRAWISQTPNVIRVLRTSTPHTVATSTLDLKTWERDNQYDLKRLCAVLEKSLLVVGAVEACEVTVERGRLKVWKVQGEKVAPKEVLAKLVPGGSEGGGAEASKKKRKKRKKLGGGGDGGSGDGDGGRVGGGGSGGGNGGLVATTRSAIRIAHGVGTVWITVAL